MEMVFSFGIWLTHWANEPFWFHVGARAVEAEGPGWRECGNPLTLGESQSD